MIHIISNPQNGAPIDHEGVKLEPGFEQPVRESVAEELSQRFGFLLMRVVPGTFNAKKSKPRKIPGVLTFTVVEDPNPDVPDTAEHTLSGAARAPRKKAAKKATK